MFCPQCKAEFRPGFTRCKRCEVDLVASLPEEKEPLTKCCSKCQTDYPEEAEFCPQCRVDLIPKPSQVGEPAVLVCPQCHLEYRQGFNQCTDCYMKLDEIENPSGSESHSEEPISGELIQVATSFDSSRALMIQSILEGHGISCVLNNENLIGLVPYYAMLAGGIKVMVQVQDAEEAKKIIAEIERESPGSQPAS